MSITALQVQELRKRTGAGMMECKKALVETQGDIDAAIDAMRKSGQVKAAKRAGRIAAEGVIKVAVSSDKRTAVMIEVNSETDFVARDASFKAFADQAIQHALASKVDTVEALMQQTANGSTLDDSRQELVHKIGENIQVRRIHWVKAEGIIGAYLHGDRIGVLVALDKENETLAKDIAMHIAASKPESISETDVPAALIEKEKEIFRAQAKESGKPDNIIEKMIEGRIRKYFEEICLVGQPFVKNPDQTVGELLKANGAKVTAFIRFEVGEGIEKEVVDFAEEVKKVQAGS